MIGALRMERKSFAEIGRRMGRSGSTISREHKRNQCHWDQKYRASHAQSMTNRRRRESRQGGRFKAEDHREVVGLLRRDWSPEQISGSLRRSGRLQISHETIYKWILQDKNEGGDLYEHLRCARKQRRKRYRAYDSRGRLAGKRMIGERPEEVESRLTSGHWEIDTVHGSGKHSIVTLVERRSGYTEIGKIEAVTMKETTRSILELMSRHLHRYKSITADNGSEFHDYKTVEAVTDVPFYFATPHHSWERGTNENTNGLIRQYLPKGADLRFLSQQRCNQIAKILNDRPRKRHGYRTPKEIFNENI